MTRAEGFTNQGDYTPDNLLAGEYPRIERQNLRFSKCALPKTDSPTEKCQLNVHSIASTCTRL